METFTEIYNSFLAYFPNWLHPFISVALAILLIYSIFQALKRNFIFLIILVILLPASIPILKNVLDSLIALIKYLIP